MLKFLIVTIALYTSSAFALPAPTDEVVKAVMINPDFSRVLQENPGFKSVKVNVLSRNEVPDDIESLCGAASGSRSRSIVEVELTMRTSPQQSIRVYHFITDGRVENLKPCP